jgi:hypothetical protein
MLFFRRQSVGLSSPKIFKKQSSNCLKAALLRLSGAGRFFQNQESFHQCVTINKGIPNLRRNNDGQEK